MPPRPRIEVTSSSSSEEEKEASGVDDYFVDDVETKSIVRTKKRRTAKTDGEKKRRATKPRGKKKKKVEPKSSFWKFVRELARRKDLNTGSRSRFHGDAEVIEEIRDLLEMAFAYGPPPNEVKPPVGKDFEWTIERETVASVGKKWPSFQKSFRILYDVCPDVLSETKA